MKMSSGILLHRQLYLLNDFIVNPSTIMKKVYKRINNEWQLRLIKNISASDLKLGFRGVISNAASAVSAEIPDR